MDSNVAAAGNDGPKDRWDKIFRGADMNEERGLCIYASMHLIPVSLIKLHSIDNSLIQQLKETFVIVLKFAIGLFTERFVIFAKIFIEILYLKKPAR